MEKDRLQAFSDGVIAILITIMVLELHIPTPRPCARTIRRPRTAQAAGPVFLSYVLSFVNLGIYWNNHHHLLAATQRITGGVLWANMHLLFWLSLFPFFTGWMGENHFDPLPTAAYGCILLLAAIAYFILTKVDRRRAGPGIDVGSCARRRLQGEDLAGHLRDRHPDRVREPLGVARHVRKCLAALARTRPSHRVEVLRAITTSRSSTTSAA